MEKLFLMVQCGNCQVLKDGQFGIYGGHSRSERTLLGISGYLPICSRGNLQSIPNRILITGFPASGKVRENQGFPEGGVPELNKVCPRTVDNHAFYMGK